MKNNIIKLTIILIVLVAGLQSCNRNSFEYDASGTFETTEIIVSAEAMGKIEKLNLHEGDFLSANQYIGYIDTTQLHLKKMQLKTTNKAVSVRRPDIAIQIASLKDQIARAEKDKLRIENLFNAEAATQKQLDDATTNLNVLKSNLAAQINSLSNSVSSINEESSAYEIQIAQIEDQLQKSNIVNPIDGVVLNKYAEAYEMATTGRPLYKIGNMKSLSLRAYILYDQLAQIKLGQEVKVFINTESQPNIEYKGVITWIAEKAEFTPKTIQTKDERQNLVYAIKIAVDNADGKIKIGMYGDVAFK